MSDTATDTEAQTPTDDLLKAALRHAKGIAYEGCHKIYVLLDDGQFAQQKLYGYGDGSDDSQLVALRSNLDRDRAFATVKQWYEDSCALRFISTIKTVPGDPNDGFDHVIEQFEDWTN